MEITAHRTQPDGRRGSGTSFLPNALHNLQDVRLEESIGGIRPDVLADAVDGDRTHTGSVPVMDLGVAAQAVLEDPLNHHWIYHPERERLAREAEEKAIAAAQAQPQLQQSTPKQTRLCVIANSALSKRPRTVYSVEKLLIDSDTYASAVTAYVENQQTGDRQSISRASDSGMITSYGVIYEGDDGGWYYLRNPDDVVFEPGRRYAVFPNIASAKLVVSVPGNNCQLERAQADMLREADKDSRFTEVIVEGFVEEPNWYSGWDLRALPFRYSSSNGAEKAYVYHVTSRNNPLVRYVGFSDPDTGQWVGWERIKLSESF